MGPRLRTILSAAFVFAICALPNAGAVAQPADDEEAARAHFEAGRALVDAGSFRSARQEFRRGFELSLRPLFLFNMAECARELNDAESARREYATYLGMDPEGDFAPLARERLESLGPGDTAAPDFVAAATANARAREERRRAERAYDAGRFSEALDAFNEAFAATNEPALLYRIAQCHEALGDSPEAQRSYRRFLDEAPPGAPGRTEAEAKLQANGGSSSGPSRLRVGGIVSLAVSGAALVSMAVSGAMTLSQQRDLDALGCAPGCEEAAVLRLERRARTFDVSAAVSLLAFATGLTLVLLAPDEEQADQAPSLRVAPAMALSGAGVEHAAVVVEGAF